VNARLVRDLAALLKEPVGMAEKTLAERLSTLPAGPSLAELSELAERARRSGASDEELGLAVAALLACSAPPAGAIDL
jgi:hypothetical protein